MMYFYLGNSDYVYIALNKHSRILVYALILKDPKLISKIQHGVLSRNSLQSTQKAALQME